MFSSLVFVHEPAPHLFKRDMFAVLRGSTVRGSTRTLGHIPAGLRRARTGLRGGSGGGQEAGEMPLLSLHRQIHANKGIQPELLHAALVTKVVTLEYLLELTCCSRKPCLVAMHLSAAFDKLSVAKADFHQLYKEYSTRFSSVACDLLGLVPSYMDARELIGRGDEGIMLAVSVEQKQFIAHEHVQRRLTEIWRGAASSGLQSSSSHSGSISVQGLAGISPKAKFVLDFLSYLLVLAGLTALALLHEVCTRTHIKAHLN